MECFVGYVDSAAKEDSEQPGGPPASHRVLRGVENGGNPTETARDASKNASGSGDGTSVVAVGRATFGHLRPPSASRNSRVPAVDAPPAVFHVKCRTMTGTLHRFSRRLEWCVSYYTVGTSPIRNFARLDLKGQKKGEHVRQTTFCVEGRAVSILLVLYQHISNCNYILACIIYRGAMPSNSHRVFTISRIYTHSTVGIP